MSRFVNGLGDFADEVLKNYPPGIGGESTTFISPSTHWWSCWERGCHILSNSFLSFQYIWMIPEDCVQLLWPVISGFNASHRWGCCSSVSSGREFPYAGGTSTPRHISPDMWLDMCVFIETGLLYLGYIGCVGCPGNLSLLGSFPWEKWILTSTFRT